MTKEAIIDVMNRKWYICLVEPKDEGYIAYAYCEGWLFPEPTQEDWERPEFKTYIRKREYNNPFIINAIGYTMLLARENVTRYIYAAGHEWASRMLTQRQNAFTYSGGW